MCWGSAACLAGAVRDRGWLGGRDLAGACATLAGFASILIWLRALQQLAGSAVETNGVALTIAIAGIVVILATVWTGIRSMGPLLFAVDYALAALPRLRAVVRPAAGYLGYQRWRSALTVIMFGMVIVTMVLSTTLIHVAAGAYGGSAGTPAGGYDLRADVHGSALGDLQKALGTARAVKASDFTATGSVATADAQIVQLGLARASWQSTSLVIVDDDFLRGMQGGLQRRMGGYSSDAAVWAVVREQTGAAVVMDRDGSIVNSNVRGGSSLDVLGMWARPVNGGKPLKLSVLGMIDGSSE